MGKLGTFFDLNQAVSLSAGHDRMVVFARRDSGELAYISEVDNGKACNCTCLACDEPLIARQGEIREHSFAHQSGTQCHHALDAMMHAVAAALIERHGRFVTPALRVQAAVEGPHGPISDVRNQPAIQVPVEQVETVRRAPWKHKCVVAAVRGHSLLIHIALRRRADAPKIAALAELGHAAVEIDLTRHAPATVAELSEILFGADERKTWLHNPKSAAMAAEIQSALQPVAAQQWQDYHDAIRVRRQQDEQRAAAMAERERERPARVEAPADGFQGLPRRPAHENLCNITSAATRRKAAKPAEFSPSIEYVGTTGRVWLLHSSQPEIHFRVEPGVQHELQVLCRHGAVEAEPPGVFRIPRKGWSDASVELAGTWRSVHSVDHDASGQTMSDL